MIRWNIIIYLTYDDYNNIVIIIAYKSALLNS